MRLGPYQIRTLLGGLLLLAVLASSYGLPANGAFFFPFHSPRHTGDVPHDFPHGGVTHRHAPRGGGGFMPVANGETHRTIPAGSAPDEHHAPGSFGHDGGHPGGDGGGSPGGGQHQGGPPGGFPGAGGHGLAGYSPPAGAPPDGGGGPAGSHNDLPGTDTSEVWSDNAPGDESEVAPDAISPPPFDAGCPACDFAGPAYDDFQPDLPLAGDLPKNGAQVPEPSSLLLLAPALLAFAAARARLASGRGDA